MSLHKLSGSVYLVCGESESGNVDALFECKAREARKESGMQRLLYAMPQGLPYPSRAFHRLNCEAWHISLSSYVRDFLHGQKVPYARQMQLTKISMSVEYLSFLGRRQTLH